jgi:hypothetical protein
MVCPETVPLNTNSCLFYYYHHLCYYLGGGLIIIGTTGV